MSKKKTKKEFIIDSIKIHELLYDYSKSNYKTYSNQIIIICPVHGEFNQIARDHLSGYGCYECGLNKCGYLSLEYIQQNKKIANIPTILYLAKVYSETEFFYKVGITTHSFNHRFKSHPVYEFEPVKELKTNLLDAYEKEQKFKKDYFKFKYIPKYYFEGITECFKKELYAEIFPN